MSGSVSIMSTGDPRALSFGDAAASYQRGRPEYPVELVEWLIGDARQIVDAGAGTGKLTGVMLGLGHELTAVDPDPRMLDALSQKYPQVDTHPGSAESLPLPDNSADLITFGQAWHWVDPGPASIEVARVLKPGGTLGLIWNLRDEQVDWVAELTDIIKPSAAEQLLAAGPPPYGPPLTRVDTNEMRWSYTITVDLLCALVSSRSHYLSRTADEQAGILARVRALGDRLVDDQGHLHLPYVTEAYRITV